MCGIAGIQFKQDVDTAVLDRAAAHFAVALQHRGPDDFGAHRTPRSVFVNLRLAIVDRSGGHQPLYAPDAARGIVYNGEVYNWQAVRAPLEARYPFTTQSDTEAVLAHLLAHGASGLQQLNGMFGLCLWDDRDGSLLLARDRFGAKPMYVYEDDRCIAFASELRTLLGLDGTDHTLDPVGFQDYLSYRYNLAPYTQFARIRKLPAGCWLRHAGGATTIERYAEVTVHEPASDKRTEADCIAELDGLLGRAVRSQLMGEVPIGVLLSGGLDSSAIAAYVHQAGARLKAYSIGFSEVNEFEFSRAVARRFELDYVEITLTQAELRSGMDGVIAQLDEPIADPACFALSRLCARIRDDVTVVLSGEGGDEMFAGYHHHQLALQPGLDRNTAFAHFFQHSASFTDANQWLRDKTLPPHHLRHRTAFDRADTLLCGMQTFELQTWMPENLMMKADKVLMAHSLEGRFPFLDLDLYRFASTLPASMKLPHAGSSKHVLRQLMSTQLPAAVIQRRKMGFTVPPVFFLQPLQTRLLDAVDALRSQPVADVLDLDAITGLLRRFYGGDAGIPVLKVWNIAVLVLWWADVYPGLRQRPSSSAAAATATATVTQPKPATGAAVSTEVTGAKDAAVAAVARGETVATGHTGGTGETVVAVAVATAAAPAPAAPAVAALHPPPRRRLVVYTALIGAKEALASPLAGLPADARTDLDLDFVCITDDPDLRSPVWRMQSIGSRHLQAEKLSRRPKSLPHEYFPDAAFSLYIDNTVTFRRLPQAADLDTARPYLFRAFRHATRTDPGEEAAAIASLGYDDVETLCRQLDFIDSRRPLAGVTPLTTGTVLLREHRHPAIVRFGVLWWESILAFSKRDQLSLDFARLESGCDIEHWPGGTQDNPLIRWNGSLSPQRVKASFDARRYAWLHRDDPGAVRDPGAHFLAQGRDHDAPYLRAAPLLGFVCHHQRSSLGSHTGPRRGVAGVLEPLLQPHRRTGCRYLVVRVQGGTQAQAFDAAELEAAGRALAMFMGPARGTVMDLPYADLRPDGKVYTTDQPPFTLLLVIGADAATCHAALNKLLRLVDRARGAMVAVLTDGLSISAAAAVQQDVERHITAAPATVRALASSEPGAGAGALPAPPQPPHPPHPPAAVHGSLHASHHDDLRTPIANSVLALEWHGTPQTTVTAT